VIFYASKPRNRQKTAEFNSAKRGIDAVEKQPTLERDHPTTGAYGVVGEAAQENLGHFEIGAFPCDR